MSENISHLDLPIPADLRAEWAAEFARLPEARTNDAERKLFLFRLGAEWFGLDPTVLAGTLPDSRPRCLPHRRNTFIDGVVVFDGRVIVCLALDRLFNLRPSAEEKGTRRLLVVSWRNWTFAFRVDEAIGVEELLEAEIKPLSQTASDLMRRCAAGVTLHRTYAVTCLDAEPLIRELEAAMQ
ncbi:hypothetical protein BH09VER1_BH09VER1_36910 [soil metagenome]